jgi:nitrite reductase/ring-hydroxylating ferredoxin subunit
MLGAAVTGAADYADTDGTARTRATLHATLMVVALVILLVSLGLRAGGDANRTVAIALGIVAFLIVSAGAFVGGDVVYVFGNMVNRHAFRGAGTKWIRLDVGGTTDLMQLPEATPTKAKAGINDLVLVRSGDTVNALHAVCAHAGGPLAEGTVVDGCIECPWHASRFRLSDGRLRRGPSVYDQPAYEIRPAETGGYEVRRRA